MPKEKKAPATCLLGIHPGERGGKCPDASACAHCGWHPAEAQARAWAIRAIGLKVGPDGLQRLVIRRWKNFKREDTTHGGTETVPVQEND